MNKLINTPRSIQMVRIVVFLAVAVLSNYLDLHRPPVMHYFVGTIFGIVVMVWQVRTLRDLIHWHAMAFIAGHRP